MPLSLYALDKFVAQELSHLTECSAVPIAPDFPDYESWLSMFALNWMLRIPASKDKASLAFTLIRRAEASIADYEGARVDLSALVAGERKVSLYFRSLRKFESTVSVLYQAFDFARKALPQTLFTPGDGSPYERLNIIYNTHKHADPQLLPAGQLHTVWIKNEGLATEGATLTFDELRDLIREIAGIADKLAKGEAPA